MVLGGLSFNNLSDYSYIDIIMILKVLLILSYRELYASSTECYIRVHCFICAVFHNSFFIG